MSVAGGTATKHRSITSTLGCGPDILTDFPDHFAGSKAAPGPGAGRTQNPDRVRYRWPLYRRGNLMLKMLITLLALALLMPTTAVAREPADKGTWPTATELRRELQAIGYEFGWDSVLRRWEGGPALASEPTIRVYEDFDGTWAAVVTLDVNESRGVWPATIDGTYTALAEVLSAVLLDPAQRLTVLLPLAGLAAGGTGCYVLRLSGGAVEMVVGEGPVFVRIGSNEEPSECLNEVPWPLPEDAL